MSGATQLMLILWTNCHYPTYLRVIKWEKPISDSLSSPLIGINL